MVYMASSPSDLQKSEIHQPFKEMVGMQSVNGAIPIQKIMVPVLAADPPISVVAANTLATTGVLTLYTTATYKDKDFYLIGFTQSITKNAACDTATGALGVLAYIGGNHIALHKTAVITLTASSTDAVVMLPRPLKIDKGTAITIAGTFTAGVMYRAGTVYGVYI